MKDAFHRHISEIQSISNFMKIRPVEAELFHVGGRTDFVGCSSTVTSVE
jgi:hypothetical protein